MTPPVYRQMMPVPVFQSFIPFVPVFLREILLLARWVGEKLSKRPKPEMGPPVALAALGTNTASQPNTYDVPKLSRFATGL